MPPVRLDKGLLEKMAHMTEKSAKYVREQISKRASRLGISSEAEQVLWARELGIGTARYQRILEPHIQEQIRVFLPYVFSSDSQRLKPKRSRKRLGPPRERDVMLAAIEYLLADHELRSRCTDLLRAKANFDRVIREATTVLDDRLRKLAGITNRRIDPSNLVVDALHPNRAILRVSPNDDEQEGFFFICKGLFQAFRNPTHHQLSEKFTRESALRFCGFVDSLLMILEQAQKKP